MKQSGSGNDRAGISSLKSVVRGDMLLYSHGNHAFGAIDSRSEKVGRAFEIGVYSYQCC